MDYKEKYEQALENIKRIKKANRDNKELVDFIEYQYPELKESDDDRIKTNIIKLLRFVRDTYHQYSDECNESIDWLKKQSNKDTIEHILPELKESEDERIKKAVIEFIRQNKSFTHCKGVSKADCLAWLEKQGKQTRTDAFIEKAYEWFEKNWSCYINTYPSSLAFDAFKNYMKGE